MIMNPKSKDTLRKYALKRDNYTCQECGATENLQVHHIKAKKFHPELTYDLDNLITLCKKCHLKAHGKGFKKYKKTFSLPVKIAIYIRQKSIELEITESQFIELVVNEYMERKEKMW